MTVTRPGISTRNLRCHAPAKLNLGLRVLGRRPDGYHELESLFVPLDLGDEIGLEVSNAADYEFELAVDGAAQGVPVDERNLVARAARHFARDAGLDFRVRLRLLKRIPTGAGLGGGSSDAGAVLRAFSQLFPGALEAPALAELALGLGADVPFFLDPQPALVRGIGERVEPLGGVRPLAVVLANPGTPLATADVYRAFDALEISPTSLGRDRKPPLQSPTPGAGWELPELDQLGLENDLEPAAIRLCPSLAGLKRRLMAAGAQAAGMSGSGPTVFGLFDTAPDAEAALARLRLEPPGWARVAATVESR